MSKQQFSIREKATGKVISCDWQNAFELVNHGFWEWASGNAHKEFKKAKAEARRSNSDPAGFRDPVEDADNEDDDNDEPYTPPVAPAVSITQVASTAPVADEEDIDNMTKEELVEYADKLGVKLDKRTGQKNMVSAIRAHIESEE